MVQNGLPYAGEDGTEDEAGREISLTRSGALSRRSLIQYLGRNATSATLVAPYPSLRESVV